MLRRVGLLVLSLAILSGCVWPLPTVPLGIQPPQSQPAKPPTGELLDLAYGETGTVDAGTVSITFQDVLEDSRCPLNVQCAWSGWVRVQLVVQAENAPAATLEITSFTDQDGRTLAPTGISEAQPFATYNQYLLELESVTPYPARHEESTPLADYRIVLRVRLQTNPAKPTPVTTPVADGLPPATPEVMACPDAQQLPILCRNYRVIVEYTAGVSQQEPMQWTEPVAACTLTSQAAGTEQCLATLGEGWEMADTGVLEPDSAWYEFVPTGETVWLWDGQQDQATVSEREQ
jgi:hypothetical protein